MDDEIVFDGNSVNLDRKWDGWWKQVGEEGGSN
jgi:hypothetical protein